MQMDVVRWRSLPTPAAVGLHANFALIRSEEKAAPKGDDKGCGGGGGEEVIGDRVAFGTAPITGKCFQKSRVRAVRDSVSALSC